MPVSDWPRLSADLAGPRHPGRCQSCGGSGDDATLLRWRECDDHDRPTGVVVVLCRGCSDRLIERHPRLYAALDRHQPWPGCMPLCADCRHRDGTRCAHPAAKLNGGPGLELAMPRPVQAHVCRRGKGQRSGWQTLYPGPVRACTGREGVALD